MSWTEDKVNKLRELWGKGQTASQIAEIIGVNVSTIKRWTDSGKLECQQTIGGHRKFHLNHLRKFLKEIMG